jgi:outer membrane receptor protein involved in Fe transport
VPVVAGGSFSFINLQNEWFFNQQLSNAGKGRNYGVDLTLERYLTKGYYFLVTASLFNSEYKGGDDTWRNTAYNRRFLVNVLGGKEWQLGEQQQNVFSINTRFTFQGGDPFTPVNNEASIMAKEVIYDDARAYSKQTPSSLILHFTTSYKINKQKKSHEIALKIINVNMYSDFFGFRYNYLSNMIDEHREAIMIPNLSYKIEF